MPADAIVTTERGDQVRRIPDPGGGSCDAAGDFERLIPTECGGLLDAVDEYGLTIFNRLQVARVLTEVRQLLERDDLTDRERRGLLRLVALAEKVASEPHLYLKFIGD